MFRKRRMYVDRRFSPRLRSMEVRTLPDDDVFHPVEPQRVPVLEVVLGRDAIRHLQDVPGPRVRRIAGAGSALHGGTPWAMCAMRRVSSIQIMSSGMRVFFIQNGY